MTNARLGFDIGSNSMKIAVARGESLRLEEVRLPENLVDGSGIAMPHAFAQFLKQVRKELHLPRGRAALVLPASQVICRMVTMPRMTEDQLLLNLPYEFSDFIQGGADQYFCDYALCEATEEDGEGVPMMAAAVLKQQAAEYIRMFAQAGLRLKTLLPMEMALLRLARAGEHGGTMCFVDLGQQSTRIIVIARDRVQAMRQVAIGGKDLDAAIADQMGVDAFLANSYKPANYQGVLDGPACGGIYEQIAVEILKVLNFYQFTYRESSLAGLYLAGGGARIGPLRAAIEGMVDLELLPVEGLLPGLTDGGAAAGSGLFAAGMAAAGKGRKA